MAKARRTSVHDRYSNEKTLRKEEDERVQSEAWSKEAEILCAWALRFDGYAYQQETNLDSGNFMERYFKGYSLDWARPRERQAMFFLLQRWLMKWGGVAHLRKAGNGNLTAEAVVA